ncbi:MAG: hypothetical protein LBV18_01790 [Alistipes sp.]|jgi:hypothetical protein|nr:hypothetical protein [Alistipes sp.]
MRKTCSFALLVIAAAVSSCSATKYVASDVDPAEIYDVARLGTISDIALVWRGEEAQYDELISEDAGILVSETLDRMRVALDEMIVSDPVEREILQEEMDMLLSSVSENRKEIQNVRITPAIDALLTANGERFGLILLHTGFTRVKGNYGKQVAKGVGVAILVGVLSGGMVVGTTNVQKANSTMHAIIVDSERDNIAFYNSVTGESEPASEDVVSRQVIKLFKGLFW